MCGDGKRDGQLVAMNLPRSVFLNRASLPLVWSSRKIDEYSVAAGVLPPCLPGRRHFSLKQVQAPKLPRFLMAMPGRKHGASTDVSCIVIDQWKGRQSFIAGIRPLVPAFRH